MRYSIALKCSIFWMKPPAAFWSVVCGRKSSSQMARQYRVDNFHLKTMLVGSSVSRINRLNIHESSSFVLNDISYRLIIAQKQEMKACLFAFYLFLTNWYIQFEEGIDKHVTMDKESILE